MTAIAITHHEPVRARNTRAHPLIAFLVASAMAFSCALTLALLPMAACQAQSTTASPTTTRPSEVPGAASSVDTARVEKSIRERFKGAPITHVSVSPISGLYEAMISGQIYYFNADATHFIGGGNLIDAVTGRNLTEQRVAELSRIDTTKLPLADAIKVVRGNGERVLFVFSDVDCPFCQRLEQTLQTLANVTVYNFMYPIDQLHPQAHKKQVGIWCANDRLKAWEDALLRRKFDPHASTDCTNPVETTKKLGVALGVRATPTMYTADGRHLMGALSKEQIEAALNAAPRFAQSKE